MLSRPIIMERLSEAVRRAPVTALLGPRQCGKTTIAKEFSAGRRIVRFDLESSRDRVRLQNPELALQSLVVAEGERQGDTLVVLDEIQFMPVLFNVLRVVVDHPGFNGRFLILGSASPDVVRGVSETLAGRIEFVEMGGFALEEVGAASLDRLWVRGGMPRSFLAPTESDSRAWREGFIETFLQRDIAQLGFAMPPDAMRRLWTMLAHYHGQTLNASELGVALDLSSKTIRTWLDVLTGMYMVRQLLPWFENISKRQVKAPKVYVRDSGLLHTLLEVDDYQRLMANPKVGASWEGFAIEEVLRVLRPPVAYFWGVHTGAELDLLVMRGGGKRHGFEMKFSEAPTMTRSMHSAHEVLNLEHLWVIYPGAHRFPLNERTTAIPLAEITGLRNEI